MGTTNSAILAVPGGRRGRVVAGQALLQPGLRFVQGHGFVVFQHLGPAGFGGAVEILVAFVARHRLGHRVEHEGVGGFAGAFRRRRQPL
jgi:hypothetical protein